MFVKTNDSALWCVVTCLQWTGGAENIDPGLEEKELTEMLSELYGEVPSLQFCHAFLPDLSIVSSDFAERKCTQHNHQIQIHIFFLLVCVFQGIVWCAISAGSCISFCTTLDHDCSHGTLFQTNQFSLLMTWLQEPDSEAVHWTFYLASRGTGRQFVFHPAESRVRHAKKETWIGTQVHECQCDPQLWRLGNCFSVISLIRCQPPSGDLHYACRAHHYCHFLPQAWPSQTVCISCLGSLHGSSTVQSGAVLESVQQKKHGKT